MYSYTVKNGYLLHSRLCGPVLVESRRPVPPMHWTAAWVPHRQMRRCWKAQSQYAGEALRLAPPTQVYARKFA